MTFPSVADTSTSSETGNTTTHTVDLSTLTMTVGNLLLIGFAHDQNLAGTWTWPAAYTSLFDTDANNVGLEIRFKQIDGTEGSSFDVTSSGSEQSAQDAIPQNTDFVPRGPRPAGH